MDRLFYTAATVFTAILGLVIVSFAALSIHEAIKPGTPSADAATWWVLVAATIGAGGLFLWPLVLVCRRLRARWVGVSESSQAAVQRRRQRLLRLVVCVILIVPFGAWYAERAWRSAYVVPPLAKTLQLRGVLLPPVGRNRFIAIETRQGRVVLGCRPNDRYSADCLPRAEHQRLAGSQVTASFFTYPDALRSRNLVVQMRSADGDKMISYAKLWIGVQKVPC